MSSQCFMKFSFTVIIFAVILGEFPGIIAGDVNEFYNIPEDERGLAASTILLYYWRQCDVAWCRKVLNSAEVYVQPESHENDDMHLIQDACGRYPNGIRVVRCVPTNPSTPYHSYDKRFYVYPLKESLAVFDPVNKSIKDLSKWKDEGIVFRNIVTVGYSVSQLRN